MTAPAIFTFEGVDVRHYTHDGEPVWMAKDVCDAAGISKYRDAVAQLDQDERVSVVVDTLGGPQSASCVTEAGVFGLILIGRSDRARRFKRWVTHDVLPALRANGTYSITPPRELSRLELIDLARDSELGRIAAEAEAAELRPAAAAWTALADAAGDYSLREAAEILCRANIKTGQNILARQLKEIGWTDRRGRPYQTQINNGRLAVRTLTYDHRYTGEPQITTQIRVTGKGVDALYRAFTGTSLALVGAP